MVPGSAHPRNSRGRVFSPLFLLLAWQGVRWKKNIMLLPLIGIVPVTLTPTLANLVKVLQALRS